MHRKRLLLPLLILGLLFSIIFFFLASPYCYQAHEFQMMKPVQKKNLLLRGIYSGPSVKSYRFTRIDDTLDNRIKKLSMEISFLPSFSFVVSSFVVSEEQLRRGSYIGCQGNGFFLLVDKKKKYRIDNAGHDVSELDAQTNDGRQISWHRLPFDKKVSVFSPIAFVALPGIFTAGFLLALYFFVLLYLHRQNHIDWVAHLLFWLPLGAFLYAASVLNLCHDADSSWQYYQMSTGQYTLWHPPILPVFWKFLATLCGWITGTCALDRIYILFLSAMYWSGIYLFVKRLQDYPSGRMASLFLFVLSLLPLLHADFSILLGSATKDAFLAVLCVFLFSLIFFSHQRPERKKIVFIPLVVVLFFAVMSRHNAMPALLVPVWFFFLPSTDHVGWKHLFRATFHTLILFVAIIACGYLLESVVLKSRNDHPMNYSMMQQILAIRALSGDRSLPSSFPEDVVRHIDQVYYYGCEGTPLDLLLWYDLRIAGWNDDIARDVTNFWMESIFRHPLAWMQHGLNMFTKLMMSRSDGKILFTPFINLGLCLVIFVTAIIKRTTSLYPAAIFALCAIVYVSTYLLFCPGSPFRFLLLFYICSWMAMAIAFASHQGHPVILASREKMLFKKKREHRGRAI